MNEPERLFRQMVRSMLADAAAPDEVYRTVNQAGMAVSLPPELLQGIANEIVAERWPSAASAPAAQAAAPAPASLPPPQLFIDWGRHIEAYSDLSPEFRLICPGLKGQPCLLVQLDDRLDHAHWRERPELSMEEEFQWVFEEKLRLTLANEVRGGGGNYTINVNAIFPEAEGTLARCYAGRFHFTVAGRQEQSERTLEIQGTDAAMVNMLGSDLRHFTKICLKGEGQSLINVQERFRSLGEEFGRVRRRLGPAPLGCPIAAQAPRGIGAPTAAQSVWLAGSANGRGLLDPPRRPEDSPLCPAKRQTGAERRGIRSARERYRAPPAPTDGGSAITYDAYFEEALLHRASIARTFDR